LHYSSRDAAALENELRECAARCLHPAGTGTVFAEMGVFDPLDGHRDAKTVPVPARG